MNVGWRSGSAVLRPRNKGFIFSGGYFTPFMLWHLYKAGWNKAIAVFFVTVLLPAVVFQFIPTENRILEFLLVFVPLVFFISIPGYSISS